MPPATRQSISLPGFSQPPRRAYTLDSHNTRITRITPISVTINLRAIFSSCLRIASAALRAAMHGDFSRPQDAARCGRVPGVAPLARAGYN
ncbi:MAG: hypothetical protein AB1453_12310 [Chloroflexota bacterium]